MQVESVTDCVGSVCTLDFSPVRDLPKITLSLKIDRREAKPCIIETPQDASKMLNFLRESTEEKFIAIHLNAKYEVIGLHEVSHGTLSASLVHPREVFKAAMLSNAYAIMLAHNHPSGAMLEPSDEDITTTKQLIEAARLMGVQVIDHIIVSPHLGEYYSIREHNPYLWF